MAATINLSVKSDFAAASADLKKFGTVTEAQAAKMEKFVKSFKENETNNFQLRLKRTTAAIKATDGATAAATVEQKMLRKEIQRLIKGGVDPLDDSLKDLTGQYKKLEKEMEDVGQEAKKNQASMKRTEGAMLAIGAGAVVMGKRALDAFVDFSRESLKAASDAEEVAGKYEVVFRSIADNGEGMASSLASDFDLANSTAKELLGNTGDLLTGFGLTGKSALQLSDETNRLALDLASFTNAQGGAAAVSAALTKSYAGERESLKTYGIVISEADVQARLLKDAQAGLIFENEKAAKAYATLSLATEQSKNAIGDYARTSESAANVQKTLDEQIKRSKEIWGDYLNNGLTPVRAGFRDFLKEMNDAQEANRNLNSVVSTGVGDVAKAIEQQKIQLENAKSSFKTLSEQGSNYAAAAAEAVNKQQELLDVLERRFAIQKRGQTEQQAAIDAENEAAAEAKRVADIQMEALERLAELNTESLSTEDRKIQAIDAEIAKWTELIDISGSQEVINELLENKNDLLEQAAAKVEALAEKEAEAAEKAQEEADKTAQAYQDLADRRVEAHKQALIDIGEANEEAAEAEKELAQDVLDDKIAKANLWLGIASKGLSVLDSLRRSIFGKELSRIDAETAAKVSAMTTEVDTRTEEQKKIDAIEEAGARKKAQIEYKSALIGWGLQLAQATATGAQAIISGFASQPFLPVGLAMGALASTATAVQLGTIAASKPQAPSFQTGTGILPFMVPESTASSRADNQSVNVSPGEQVSVTPRGGGGRSQNISVSIADRVIFDVVNEGIESGDIRITADNIQGGAAVA